MSRRYQIAREAIRAGDSATLSRLLRAGLNPNIPAFDGRFLVHDAVIFDAGGESLTILARHGADLNARWINHLNWTAAHLAAFKERPDILRELRALGANTSLPDARGWRAARSAPCPITRIEAQRKLSPMAMLVSHSRTAPVFA